MNIEDFEIAKKVRLNSYSPYSNYQVGAVLRTNEGKIYTGCNIENNGIQSICAERTAFAKAISEGEKNFQQITIVGAKKGEEPKEACMPCGYCRQFISEFVNGDFKICVENDGNYCEYTINELLPKAFNKQN